MVNKVIDFLIQLKNSSQIFKTNFYIKKHTKFSNLLFILYKTGFIQSFSSTSNTYYCIKLRYYYNKPVLFYLKIFSKPSLSIYFSLIDICKLPTKKLLFFFSTAKNGIVTQLDCKKQKTGGKLLFMC
jgi:ribosomal protein S8